MSNQIELRIDNRQVFADGFEFGDTGAYERLCGKVIYRVDPLAPAQRGIVDLDKAPRDSNGLVECSTDLFILRPLDPARGNRCLFFGYGNRGNKRELQFFNDAPGSNDPLTKADAGNGFLMRRGYTIVWAAWEGDLLPGDGRMLMYPPIASTDHGPITGVVRTEFIVHRDDVYSFPLSGQTSTHSYPSVSMDTRDARLVRRRYPSSEPEVIAPSQWRYARHETGFGMDAQGVEGVLVDSDRHIYLPGGFEPGWIYELPYTAKDPLVLGLGHLVVRDLVSFLKHESVDSAGNDNPTPGMEKAYAWGRSQTGRCIRDFIHQGFNADADNRRVFDGVLPHVSGGGLMWMNHRFACVVMPAGQEYEVHLTPADRFPFSYAPCTDHITGVNDAILKRPDTDPLVIHTQTSTEYWQRRGSLVHTDTQGNDLAQPDTVRIYAWSSSQHFASPRLEKPERGVAQHLENVVWTSLLFRAMLDALDGWASTGEAPRASRIPNRADGTLVSSEEWHRQFPDIPGVSVPRAVNSLPHMDFGPDAGEGIITEQPPKTGELYTVLVPAVDEDGNEIAGVRAPMVSAPLGTYTGWNLRSRGFGHGAMLEFTGSYLPFSDSPDEGKATGDPRASILERYPTPNDYQRAIEKAARQLVADGLMLEEDVPRAIERAADWNRPLHDVRL